MTKLEMHVMYHTEKLEHLLKMTTILYKYIVLFNTLFII